jgi:hypothetical protein
VTAFPDLARPRWPERSSARTVADLGLSVATVSRRLQSGMDKLGLRTPAELCWLFVR